MTTPPVSPKRVSIGELDIPIRSGSAAEKDGSTETRPSSVTRRASLPAQRVSVTEKSPSGPILAATLSKVAPSSSSRSNSINASSSSSRRASVATGMMTAPFQKMPKEAPRWRPATFLAQMSQNLTGKSNDDLGVLSVEEANKPLQQKIFDKTAVSLALELFVVLVAFVLGSVLRVVFRRDLGILGLWINQMVILLIFMFDKRSEDQGGGKRMDKFTSFEVGTLICQGLPILYTLLIGNPYSYYSLVAMVLMQVVFKFGLMHALGSVVEISL